jgi:hypothetical protein
MVEVVAVGAVPVAAAPVNPGERIDAIDILRGIALFGVLAINVVNEFRVSFFEEFLPVPSTTGTLDRAVQTFLTMAVELKAMALFSLLFWIGMAIQFERLAPDPRRGRLLARRLAILLVIGVAHLFLIWNGDILTEYSLAGFIVLPLRGGRAGCWRPARRYFWRFIWSCRCCLPSCRGRRRHGSRIMSPKRDRSMAPADFWKSSRSVSERWHPSFRSMFSLFLAPSRYSCSACWCGAPTSFVGQRPTDFCWSPSRLSALWSEPR